ncbi:alpha/beta fold hydrolase [Mucilaginibacter glaciei]|uniref:Alpha/beta hydrolase n=1 Tax=Mucilaginibacter glaciei TaxID=2772109 RepID=A0A926S7R7_9SPHI|nr:alpha/beta hydrolase [Mucilaginibacter glaciei]MBD1394976.1 alpha/beta hydrolase [Mucilaginibacter glaciei]
MKFLKNLIVTVIALLIFAVAAIALLYFVKNKEHKEISPLVRKNTNGSYVTLNLGQTHYEIDGQDTGKVVILIHGFSVPYYIWDGTFENLVENGFRVVRYDMYGRGFSDRPDVLYNQKLYMDQLSELIEALHLKKPISMAGVSFGGIVAADFAATYPDLVNKVVLIDPAYVNKKSKMPQFLIDVKEAITSTDRANGQMDDFLYPELHPDWVKLYLPQMEYKGFRNALVSTNYNYTYNGRVTYAGLNAVKKPVLLIWGKEDKTVPFNYSDSVRSVLKTDFLPVEDAAHLPHLDKTSIVNPAIVTFLKK